MSSADGYLSIANILKEREDSVNGKNISLRLFFVKSCVFTRFSYFKVPVWKVKLLTGKKVPSIEDSIKIYRIRTVVIMKETFVTLNFILYVFYIVRSYVRKLNPRLHPTQQSHVGPRDSSVNVSREESLLKETFVEVVSMTFSGPKTPTGSRHLW